MKFKGKMLRSVGRGAECRVYAFGPGRVLKLYSTVGERNRAYTRQRKAFKIGFAPPVYKKLDLGKGNRGYVSHRVRVGTVSVKDEDKLVEAVRKQGWKDFDIDLRNTGLYKGKPVVIDFGDMTLA